MFLKIVPRLLCIKNVERLSDYKGDSFVNITGLKQEEKQTKQKECTMECLHWKELQKSLDRIGAQVKGSISNSINMPLPAHSKQEHKSIVFVPCRLFLSEGKASSSLPFAVHVIVIAFHSGVTTLGQ